MKFKSDYMSLLDLQTDKPKLSFEEWKAELIRITAEETGKSANDIRLGEGAREWYDDGFSPYATFRETYGHHSGYE